MLFASVRQVGRYERVRILADALAFSYRGREIDSMVWKDRMLGSGLGVTWSRRADRVARSVGRLRFAAFL